MEKQPDKQRAANGGEPAPAAVLEAGPIARLREMGEALGRDVPRRILELYLGDAPSRLEELRRGLVDGDAEAVAWAAHALKGSSANLGASALADLCQQLERLPAEAGSAGADARLASLEAEYGRVEQAMRELLTEFS